MVNIAYHIFTPDSVIIMESLTETDSQTANVFWDINKRVLVTELNISYSSIDSMCVTDSGSFIYPEQYDGNITLTGLEEHVSYMVVISAIKDKHIIGKDTTVVRTKEDGKLYIRITSNQNFTDIIITIDFS